MAKWSRQHEHDRRRVIGWLTFEVKPFKDLGEGAKARRRALPLAEWCRAYLPHYFECEFAPFHHRMIEAVGEPGMPTFVGAFRGAGKSVLLSLARPLRRALSGECPYFIYGSLVQKLAAQNMDYVRLELEYNERIRADYGEIEVEGAADSWALELERPNGQPAPQGGASLSAIGNRHSSIKYEAFGIGMSPRGRRHGPHRPLEFVGDDLEDAQLARNPEREKNLWDWLMDEVLPALEPAHFTFTVLGTMFGPGCMLERARKLAARRDSKRRPLARLFLQKVSSEGRSVWPERFPRRTLARIRSTIGLRNWLRNYALTPDDPGRPFQPQWMTTYRENDVNPSELDVVAFLDPAISERATGCPRALVTAGADRSSGVRYVLDAWIERGSPMEMVEQIFRVHRRFRPRLIGIETNGGYALIRPLLEMQSAARGSFVPVRYVTHSRPKEIRIESLCSQFEGGRWRFPHNPSAGVRTLQDQFLNYPHGFVDGPDACAGCDELLPDAFRPARTDFTYMSLQGRRDLRGL